jgi:hypothetical protein
MPSTSTTITLRRGGFFSPAKIAGDTGAYRSFKLSDFTAGSDIVSAFKYYRVVQVSYKYILVNAPNNNATFPTLLVANQDFAYSGAPGSLDEVLQFTGCESHQFGPSNITKVVTRKPTMSLDVGASAGAGNIVPAGWISTANNAVPHFGVVDWIRRYNTTTDPTHTLDLLVDIEVECKGSR